MEKYNTIAFCRESYREYYETLGRKEINESKLFDDITAFIKVAINNGYQMKIWDDGLTIVIEYNLQDEGLSGVTLEWLGENEFVETYSEESDE